mmetsp:Transcript_12155/g.34738  ORF Transcript_12155/g.34738 Transcript_12155/m.34738 type:complete len:303 (+) Transcript_12155:44-952(+)
MCCADGGPGDPRGVGLELPGRVPCPDRCGELPRGGPRHGHRVPRSPPRGAVVEFRSAGAVRGVALQRGPLAADPVRHRGGLQPSAEHGDGDATRLPSCDRNLAEDGPRLARGLDVQPALRRDGGPSHRGIHLVPRQGGRRLPEARRGRRRRGRARAVPRDVGVGRPVLADVAHVLWVVRLGLPHEAPRRVVEALAQGPRRLRRRARGLLPEAHRAPGLVAAWLARELSAGARCRPPRRRPHRGQRRLGDARAALRRRPIGGVGDRARSRGLGRRRHRGNRPEDRGLRQRARLRPGSGAEGRP